MPSKFAWTDQDSGGQTLTLKIQTQNRVPHWWQRTFDNWSLDGTVREVVTVGVPLHQLSLSIRYDPDDDQIAALIRDGLAGITITYTPDTGSPGTTAAVQLVSASRLRLEREGRQNIFAVDELVLRRLDGNEIP